MTAPKTAYMVPRKFIGATSSRMSFQPTAHSIRNAFRLGASTMSEENSQHSEDDFDTRLQRARNAEEAQVTGGTSAHNLEAKGLAFRIGTELVVAVFVGGTIGFFLDTWLGTKPWLLIVFLLLGNASGLWNIFRLTNNQGLAVGFKKRTRRLEKDNEET